MMSEKLIIIVGPTASGKSELAVKIAKKIGGEIISADSRQIYRGMDIGTGKVEGKWQRGKFKYKDIPHYLIDEINPKSQYSVARFKKQADKIIQDIFKRGKIPILCGGTAHWIDAVAFNQTLPEVKPNAKLRAELSALTPEQMLGWLKQLDPARASTIDSRNGRRLIRALEIILTTGRPIPHQTQSEKYDAIWLGINPGKEILDKKISRRLKQRLKQGIVAEVAALRKGGLSWKRLESFGLEYKFCALFLQGKLTEPEMELQLLAAIKQYAKRQMTWWKRNPQINWLESPTKVPRQLLK
jgi:tRNA dimethylallyltransferase